MKTRSTSGGQAFANVGGLRLLALDGGGIRGLSGLIILGEIMHRIQAEEGLTEVPKPCEYFDLIGGTSTGGLIAILLGRLCMSVEDAIDVYNKFAGDVFSETKWIWQDGKYKGTTLEDAVRKIVAQYDESGDGNARMRSRESERKCKTFVCAMAAVSMSSPRLFRSYSVRASQGYNATIHEAARATSAAPTFFKRIYIGVEPKEEFIDGGMGCNNPTNEVLKEAQDIWGTNHPISCIVSIGTGHPSTITLYKANWLQRILQMNLIHVLKSIATDCESLSEKFEREYGEGTSLRSTARGTYFRFSVQQGLQDIGLEEWKKMSEVKTHTLQFLGEVAVTRKIDRLADLLRERGRRQLEEPIR